MAEETIYNSIHTGEQIDSAVAWLLKHAQDHICGGAAPGTTIETPTDPTYWFAGAGAYICGSSTISIPDGRIGIISYDGSDWSSETFDVGKSIVYLDSMGEELDGSTVYVGPGMVIYDPDQSTIKKCTAPDVYETIGCNENVLYCNKVTNILYRWNTRSLNMIQVGSANFNVINDLITGGIHNALSAEMGKELKRMIDELGIADGILEDVQYDGNNIVMTFNTSSGEKTIEIPASSFGITSIQDITTNGDGTFTIVMSNGDSYSINLNHVHQGMTKLYLLNSAAALPSTPANDTIYAIKNSGGTEIETLVIGGLQFAGGGGTPDNTPRLISPMVGSQIDFNGSSTTQVFVRGVNLGIALIIETTGNVTANAQTISTTDAGNGVNIILTKGNDFTSGTLVIRSDELGSKSFNVIDSSQIQYLTAIKLTGIQWLLTDWYPTPNTEFEMSLAFGNYNASATGCAFLTTNTMEDSVGGGDPFLFRINTDTPSTTGGRAIYFGNTKSQSTEYGRPQGISNLGDDMYINPNTLKYSLGTDNQGNSCGKFSFAGREINTTIQAASMNSPIMIGYGRIKNADTDKIFNRYVVTIYRFTIKESGTVVRDYVPAIKQGVPGLYDANRDKFIAGQGENGEAVDVIAIY